MKTIPVFFLCFVLIIACTQNSERTANEAKLVQQAYENYKTAVINGKGEEALKYVDDRTLNYYANIAEQTRSADSLQVDALPLMDKMMVLFLRQLVFRERLLSFDGKSLFTYAVNSGMIGTEQFYQDSIGKVYIKGKHATGEFKSKGQKFYVPMQFHKENDQWKIDLTSTFSTTEAALQRSVKRSGKTENEFFLSSLEDVAGKQIGDAIWKPQK